jgi:hypothetical protein
MDELAYEQLGGDQGVDATAFPNVAALAADSASMTNATTNYVNTARIVPSFIDATGTLSDDYQVRLYDQYAYVESLVWDECGERYTCRGSAYVSGEQRTPLLGVTLRRSLYEAAPSFMNGLLDGATGWLTGGLDAPSPAVDELGVHTFTAAQSEAFLSDIDARTAPGTAFFAHILLPHAPYVFNADGSIVDGPLSYAEDDPRVVAEVTARYHEQTRYLDSFIGELTSRLKQEGLYQDSVILLTGDHGMRRYTAHDPRGNIGDDAEITGEIANVPLFIHGPGIEPGEYHVDYQHMDFGATLLDVLGRDHPGGSGVSAFATERPEREKVLYIDYSSEDYARYVYDEDTGTWTLTERVQAPVPTLP